MIYDYEQHREDGQAMSKTENIVLYYIIILQISRSKWKYKQNEKSTVERTKKD